MTIEEKLIALLKPERFRKSNSPKDSFEYKHPFESDYFRIVTSAPMRRLQDKTQIFPQEKSDFVRRRLTHSIEVAAIGRRLGQIVEEQMIAKGLLAKDGEYVMNFKGAIPTILETAGLVHDIGNPPFGHFGEATIQQYFKDLEARFKVEQSLEAIQVTGAHKESKNTNEIATAFSVTKFLLKEQREISIVAKAFAELKDKKNDFLYFDGNVQGLRILRHLGISADDNSFNLTMPTLAAIIKYPQESLKVKPKSKIHSEQKYGYYYAEQEDYKKLCSSISLRENHRHPLAYLLEAADDIANVTSDVEDGFKMETISYEKIKNEVANVCDYDLKFENIESYLYAMRDGSNSNIPLEKDSNELKELQIKEFRIRAVHKLIKEAADLFIQEFEGLINDSYNGEPPLGGAKTSSIIGQELLKDSLLRKTLSNLQSGSYEAQTVLKSEILGKNVITELLNMFVGCMFCEEVQSQSDITKPICLKSKSLEGKLYALISPNYKRALGCNNKEVPRDPYHRFLLAVDHVASMTDSYAVDLYNELTNKKR